MNFKAILYRTYVSNCFDSYTLPFIHLQLTCLLSELGLDIQEAHAFSTSDGYSLDVFVVTGWHLGVRTQHNSVTVLVCLVLIAIDL